MQKKAPTKKARTTNDNTDLQKQLSARTLPQLKELLIKSNVQPPVMAKKKVEKLIFSCACA